MDEPDREALLTLLWKGAREPTRGPKPTLSVRSIARLAVAIADTEGMAAVSMQRVADQARVTKMALYRYVSGKTQLVAVMIEEAWGDAPELAGVTGGWRARVEEFARCLVRTWQLHPWLPWASLGDRVMGPQELAWAESALVMLDGTALAVHERMDTAFLIFGHIRNTQSLTMAGTQPWSTDHRPRPGLEQPLSENAERYPALTAAMAAATPDTADLSGRDFGLRRILDGVETLIAQRASSTPSPDGGNGWRSQAPGTRPKTR